MRAHPSTPSHQPARINPDGAAPAPHPGRRCAAGSSTPRALPLPGSGTSAAPVPRSVRVMPPRRGPRPDTGRTRHSRSTGPGHPRVSRPSGPKNEATGAPTMVDQHGSRVPDTHTTEQPPTPEEASAAATPVSECLYEAGFSTTGPHPQGGVAIARSIHDAVNSAMKVAEPFGGVGGQPERGPPVGGSAVQPQLEHRTPRLRRSPRDPLTPPDVWLGSTPIGHSTRDRPGVRGPPPPKSPALVHGVTRTASDGAWTQALVPASRS